MDISSFVTDYLITMYMKWLLLLVLMGCSSVNYVNQTKHYLILNEGAPESVTSDGNGGEVLTYHRIISNPLSTPTTYKKEISSVYVNAEGIIYAVKKRFEPVRPTEVRIIP